MQRRQTRKGPFADLIGVTGSFHLQQKAKFLIELNEWRSASIIGLQPNTDRFGPVVFPLKELAAAAIAHALHSWWTVSEMEHGPALFAGAAATEARDNGTGWQVVANDRRERESFLLHQLLQGLSLR